MFNFTMIKYIIILLLSPLALANNWMSQDSITKANNRLVGGSVYSNKKLCEEKQGSVCYQIDGFDMETNIWGPHQVEDTTKPIYSTDPSDVKISVPCSGTTQCEAMGASIKTACAAFPGHGVETTATVAQCNLITAFGTKTVTGFHEDADLKAAQDAREECAY